ncbi:ATP binding cassette sub family A [Trichuris trichiura]|uniref:ATP binding cassette sub family A n=1 Tax=Trichuris trichiura TaxID=36087 RepID=A0A077Z8I5_TRITR|nr:ATP binding cassette sub family A [Trichuris trichiura]
MPSIGLFPMLQSYFCTLANPCIWEAIEDESTVPGRLNLTGFNNLLAAIRRDLQNDDFGNSVAVILNGVVVLTKTLLTVKQQKSYFEPVKIRKYWKPSVLYNESEIPKNLLLDLESCYLTRRFFLDALLRSLKKENFRHDFCNVSLFSEYVKFVGVTKAKTSGLQRAMCLHFPLEKVLNYERYPFQALALFENITGYSISLTGAIKVLEIAKTLERALNTLSNSYVWHSLLDYVAAYNEMSSQYDSAMESFDSVSFLLCGQRLLGFDEVLEKRTRAERLRELLIRSGSFTENKRNRLLLREDDIVANKSTKVVSDSECWEWLQSFKFPDRLTTQLFTLLRGFILVSPSTPIVKKMIDKWNRRLDPLEDFRSLFMFSFENVKNYSMIFEQSKLKKGLKILAQIYLTADSTLNLTSFLPLGLFYRRLSEYIASEKWKQFSYDDFAGNISHGYNLLRCFRSYRFRMVDTEKAMEEQAVCLSKFRMFFSGIVFNQLNKSSEALPNAVEYKIRMADFLVDQTSQIKDSFWNPRPRDRPFIDLKYTYFGFSFLQDIIDEQILLLLANDSTPVGIYVQQFPSSCHKLDLFSKSIKRTLPMFMILSWIFSVAMILRCLVSEKELHLKAFMRTMGVGSFANGLAWFVHFFTLLMTSAAMIILVLKCLLPQVAFGWGCTIISSFEQTALSLHWYEMFVPTLTGNHFGLSTVLIMLGIDTAVYLMVPWAELRKGSTMFFALFTASETWKNLNEGTESSESVNEEKVNLPVGISLTNLTKVFDNGEKGKRALNNLSVEFYDGQIACLSIVCNLFPPSHGSVLIYGKQIMASSNSVTQFIGYCPQHNVLFNDLTVKEHLHFYAGLKGADGNFSDDADDVEAILRDTSLECKVNELASSLSGGMKRRLSIAIAFIGRANVIVLDEPTTNVDPQSRRKIWDLLLRKRGTGRTILFSTHSFDEAEILSDRVALISHGQLKCCGSPSYLKGIYHPGYNLILQKADANKASTEKLSGIVKNYISDALVARVSTNELQFTLPGKVLEQLQPLIIGIGSQLKELNCLGYGLSECSIEQIFHHETGTDASKMVAENTRKDQGETAALVTSALGLRSLKYSSIFYERNYQQLFIDPMLYGNTTESFFRYGGFSVASPPEPYVELNSTKLHSTLALLQAASSSFLTNMELDLKALHPNVVLPSFSTESVQNILTDMRPKQNYKIWFNNQGWAALPAYMMALSNARLHAVLPFDGVPSDYGISVINHPMPQILDEAVQRWNEIRILNNLYDFPSATDRNLLDWDILGRPIVIMLIEGVASILLLLVIEHRGDRYKARLLFKRSPGQQRSSRETNESSPTEKEKVLPKPEEEEVMLKVLNLSKHYSKCFRTGRIVAVDGICFEVQRGECLGLLGPNGAGKTTIFKMITGEIKKSKGSVLLRFETGQSSGLQSPIGYCPQFDALNVHLTAKETLSLYAGIRGIEKRDRQNVVSACIRRLGLTEVADKLVKTYSGGFKRRLSAAVSLIGDPSLILFDEPTAGMDVKGKRLLWNTILDIVASGAAVLFTSNNMEECEILCNRVGILMSGKFFCLDTIQALKNRFGQGHRMMIKLQNCQSSQVHEMISYVLGKLPGCYLTDRNLTMAKFQLSKRRTALSEAIDCAINVKRHFKVETCSLNQNSLDDIFVQVTRSNE